MSKKSFQEWSYVAQRAGVSTSALETAMKRLTKDNKSFDKTIKELQNMDNAAERNAKAFELFGKNAAELYPILNMTDEQTESLRKKANSLGGILSATVVKSAVQLKDSITDMKTALKGLLGVLGEKLLPVIRQAVEWLTQLIVRAQQFFKIVFGIENKVESVDISKGMEDYSDATEDAIDETKKLITLIGGFDELNVLNSKDDNKNGSGASNYEFDIPGLSDGIDKSQLDFELPDSWKRTAEWIKNHFDEILKAIELVGIGLLGLKLGNILDDLGLLLGKLNLIKDLSLITIGIGLAWLGFNMATNDSTEDDMAAKILGHVAGYLIGQGLADVLINTGIMGIDCKLPLVIGLSLAFGGFTSLLADGANPDAYSVKDKILHELETYLGVALTISSLVGSAGWVVAIPITLLLDVVVEAKTGNSPVKDIIDGMFGVDRHVTDDTIKKRWKYFDSLTGAQKAYLQAGGGWNGLINALQEMVQEVIDKVFGTDYSKNFYYGIDNLIQQGKEEFDGLMELPDNKYHFHIDTDWNPPSNTEDVRKEFDIVSREVDKLTKKYGDFPTGLPYDPTKYQSINDYLAEYKKKLEEIVSQKMAAWKNALDDVKTKMGNIPKKMQLEIILDYKEQNKPTTLGNMGPNPKLVNTTVAFANGGVVNKPTIAMVGEYSGASSNPEIITPENKMRDIFNESNNALGEIFVQVGRQIVQAIQEQDNSVVIGDDVIAKAAARGNKNYQMRTGMSLI